MKISMSHRPVVRQQVHYPTFHSRFPAGCKNSLLSYSMGNDFSKYEKKRELEEETARRRMDLEDEARKRETDNVRMKLELEEEARKRETDNARKKLELEDEARKRETENARKKMELDFEARKRDTELRSEEARRNYELELKKADMAHQHKIAELITQMKQTKLQTGKELVLAYMKTMTAIIEQNNSIFQTSGPLLNQLKDEKLPSSVKGNIENVVNKAFEGWMDTKSLLEYTKSQINELQLQQNEDFSRLLDYAVERDVITQKNRLYLLE